MKKISQALLIILILISPLKLIAQTLKSSLYLENIQTTSPNKNDARKIYFIVNSFSNQNKNEFYTVPGFISYKNHHTKGYLPLGTTPFPIYYWNSQAFSQLKHVKVWQGILEENESIEINISIMERNAPPWNLDDELGVIKGVLHNKKGRLQFYWQGSNNVSLEGAFPQQQNMVYAFKIKKDKAIYQLNFYLINTPTAIVSNQTPPSHAQAVGSRPRASATENV